MKTILVFAATCALLATVQGLPIFEIPNQDDRYGKQCPLRTLTDVACPLLCVENVSQCPPSLVATCPSGLSFCGDGTCQTSCEGIDNACDCGGSSTGYVPCLAGQTVNITHFNPENKDAQTQQVCASDASLNNTNIGVWGNSTSSAVWLSCPVVNPYFTFQEPMWLAVWSLMGIEAAILVLWCVYKTVREARFHRRLAQDVAQGTLLSEKTLSASKNEKKGTTKDDLSSKGSEILSLKESERLRFRGFSIDYFGSFAFGSVIVTTLLFIVFLGCLVSDYYGNLSGVAFGVFLSSDLSSKIFCAVWHIAAAWFCAVLFFRKRLVNYFRIESFAHTCPYVQVERPQDEMIFLNDGRKWMTRLHTLERRATKWLGSDILVTTCKVQTTQSKLRYFEYQCMRYVYNTAKLRFEPYEFDLGSSNRQLRQWAHGITSQEAQRRLELLGPNLIRVDVPSIPMAIIQEFSSFIYLYQMMCMWVWYYFQYYQMGLVQTCIILLAAFIRIFLRLRAERRIQSMAEHHDQVRVYRDGEWKENVSTADLVPGDVFEIDANATIPCDAVVLIGTVVVNESSLTGEAMPVRKFALPDDDNTYDIQGSGKINTVYAGTTVSQVVPSSESGPMSGKVCVLVLRTGIASEKGMLIHKILFPAAVSFIFTEHLKVAISILLIWGAIAFGLTLYLMGRGNITSWYYGVFIMSEIFSPLLPAAFTINQSVCAARLRSQKILCIDLPRINLTGKVRIFCFDKTGTLTREGLEFYGVLPHTSNGTAETRQEDPETMDKSMLIGMGSCHAVTQVQGQLVGNPVDLESFRATQWELLPPEDESYIDTLKSLLNTKVHVVRRCEFVHARASQSAAIVDPETQHVHVYVKGSFERIKHMSRPESIPDDYDVTAAKYAREGCYVLAMTHRDLGVLGKDVTLEKVQSMSRDDLEEGCDFCGFVLFRNMLKDDTTQAIAELKGGDTRVVMITGDTALTGIFIARQCGMIETKQRVLFGDLKGGQIVWTDVDTEEEVNVDTVLADDPREPHHKMVELAVTGRAFEALIAHNKIRNYLLYIRVFARMTPTDKVHCVQLHMENGITAMCGDGGNDCGALRAAHVGLALSEAEASIVSPFSTNNRSIMQCVELLRHGRSALATSFANYKFLIFYGESMAFWELIMFYFTVIAPQPIWITIDGFITTTMTFAITQAKPAKKLAPCRPTAKPLGAYTMASCLGVIFINFWFIVCSVVWLFQQDWFVCNEFDSRSIDSARWWLLGDNYEAEMISLVIIFQFFNNAAIVNFGSVFRQSWWRNYVLVFIWCCFFVSTSFLILADPNPYSCIFRINCGTPAVLEELGYPYPWWYIAPYNSPLGHNVLPKWFRWQLWGYVLANCAANIIWERICVLWFARRWATKRNAKNPPKGRLMLKL